MIAVIAFVAALILFWFALQVQNATQLPIVLLLVLSSATWAAWDSTRIRVRDYKTTMATHPVVLWFGILLLWIVFFPWYLVVRQRIGNGTQPRKIPIPPPAPAA